MVYDLAIWYARYSFKISRNMKHCTSAITKTLNRLYLESSCPTIISLRWKNWRKRLDHDKTVPCSYSHGLSGKVASAWTVFYTARSFRCVARPITNNESKKSGKIRWDLVTWPIKIGRPKSSFLVLKDNSSQPQLQDLQMRRTKGCIHNFKSLDRKTKRCIVFLGKHSWIDECAVNNFLIALSGDVTKFDTQPA